MHAFRARFQSNQGEFSMSVNLQDRRAMKWALTALAGAVLAACGGSDSDPLPVNTLPAGVT